MTPELEKLALAIVIVATANLWEEYRDTPAERALLDALQEWVRKYKAVESPATEPTQPEGRA